MWYDFVCLVILGLSVWRGTVKGFLWQLASIAGILLCFFFAETVSLAVAPLVGLDPPLDRWVSILGLYIVGSFAAFSVARMVQEALDQIKFREYDKHLGGLFGFIKGATLCLVLSFFMFTLSERSRETVIHSQAGYASAVLFHQVRPIMPAELTSVLGPYVNGFDPEAIVEHRKNHPQHQEDPANPGQSPPVLSPIEEMIRKIPGIFGQDLHNLVYQSLSNTAPQDRPELVEQLNSGVPGLIRQVADQWKNGKPLEQVVPPTPQSDWKVHRANLLKEIAGVYTEHLDAQQLIMEEVVYSLHGLPDQITVAVLEDWRADLRGFTPDPDPSTDMRTSLDRRIVNQLSRANIALGTLPAELRQRLSGIGFSYR